jgi:hypothetical protein
VDDRVPDDRSQAVKQAGPAIPPIGRRIGFGKDGRLVVLDYEARPHSIGGGCHTTLDLRWELAGDRLRLTYLDRGCTFDALRFLLTFGPMERIG